MDHAADRIEALFAEAVGQADPARRAAFLAGACGDDSRLRARVDALLRAHDDAGGFMLAEGAGADPATLDNAHPLNAHAMPAGQPCPRPDGEPGEKPGTVIGRYKLLQQIGEGGFGVVYMAEQEKPVRRRVALKVIKVGMDTRAVIARFEAERQALAMMDHPHIARVLDAGATDTGRPYFVMELVKGIPITDYCDQANLGMRNRLELFMDVCRAVQHAHQKGVIHRDLKPSNIMVTLHDARAVVKVIDFGIAKATDQKLTEKTLFTNYGQMIGTPAYMSPEQAVMSGLDVDTRSDVYSLGVLLYELLTGSTPFDANTLRSAGFDEMRRIIREQAPEKPSTRLGTLAEDAMLVVATQRQASPSVLSRQLRGDIDWIVLKAIEKDRSRRYESASAFAEDVERHLKSEPVTAGAPSAGYRLRKFVQRNKRAMAAAAAIVVLLLAGTTVSTWQAVRATRANGLAVAAVAGKETALVAEAAQRRQAEVSEKRAVEAAAAAQAANVQAQKRLGQVEKANDILGSIFASLDPREIAQARRPLQAILVEKLDGAVAQLDGESIGDPLVVAGMQQKFGQSLIGLGAPGKAIVLLEKALAAREAAAGADHPDTLMSMNHLALAYHAAGRLEDALPLLERALQGRRRSAPGSADLPTLMAMGALAQTYLDTGRRDQGLPLLEEALNLTKATLGPDSEGAISCMNNLALAYQRDGDLVRALPLYQEAFKRVKDKFGATSPMTLVCMSNLAGAYDQAGRGDLALPLYLEALDLSKANLGPEHPSTITIMNGLAATYSAAGKLELAAPLYQESLRLARVKLGPEHPNTLIAMINLARAYQQAGEPDRALPLFEEALALAKAKRGLGNPVTLDVVEHLVALYESRGGDGDAERAAKYRGILSPRSAATRASQPGTK